MDLFLYDRDLRHEEVKSNQILKCFLVLLHGGFARLNSGNPSKIKATRKNEGK